MATCRSAINEPAYTIEVSTTIEGDYTPLPNGDPNFSHPVAVTGPQKSFTPDGNPNQECPSELDTITAQSPGLFAIGASGVDNAGLEVTVKNIRLEDLPWLFTLRKNADLVVQDSFLNEIRNKNHPCRESMVDLGSGSTFRLTNTVIIESYMAPYRQIPNVVVPNGAIFGSGASTIQLDRLKWLGSGGSNVIYGGAGSQVDIVSSWFDDVGGFMN